jgi:creatinine amidohydrolase
MHKAENFAPLSISLAKDYRYLTPEGRIGFGWQAQDLHPSGACGNARDADAARGARCVEHAAQGLVALLQEVHRYPLANIKRRGGAGPAPPGSLP